MPHPERPSWNGSGESAFPAGPALGNALTELLEQADLREVLRKAAQIVDLRGSVALPRQIAGELGPPPPLLGSQLVVDMVGAAEGQHGFSLALPVEQAGALVDRVLGGSGGVGLAARVGELSDAECGVLAYLAARLCVASGTTLRVVDVKCLGATQLLERWPRGVCWPVRLEGGGHAFDLCALFADAPSWPAGALGLELLLRDELATDALSELQPGDLLSSDRWLLTATTRGLEGSVELCVRGSSDRLRARLDGDRLVVTGKSVAGASSAELVLATVPVDVARLAAVCAGDALLLGSQRLERAVLRVAGRPVLAGTLVQGVGGIALQVSELYSTL